MKDRIPRTEIEKWLNKIRREMKNIKPVRKKGEGSLKNIHAYVNDCIHWLKEDDYVLAFESVIWAWAWMEICLQLKILKKI